MAVSFFARNTPSEKDISFRNPENNTRKPKMVGSSRVCCCRKRERQWKQFAEKTGIAAYLKTLKAVQPKKQLSFNKILDVKNGTSYGFFVGGYSHTKSFKGKIQRFSLVIKKNTFISRDDIGECMRDVAEEHGLPKNPKKYLISIHFGKEILINTEMAKIYLEMGLEIIKIKKFIEFFPLKCFAKTSR